MFGPTFTAQLAADRHASFAAEAGRLRWRRLHRQRHPQPARADLATQLSTMTRQADLTPVTESCKVTLPVG